MRVPSENFDLAMRDLRALGDVQYESVTGEEVTNEFIDLNARLKSWQAQERVLLRLMNQATSINETMDVQRELQQVQYEIEQIKGQLRVLADQSSLATASVTIHEPGIEPPGPGEVKPSWAQAWDRAVAGFLAVLFGLVIAFGYLLPIALVVALVWFLWRRFAPPPRAARSDPFNTFIPPPPPDAPTDGPGTAGQQPPNHGPDL